MIRYWIGQHRLFLLTCILFLFELSSCVIAESCTETWRPCIYDENMTLIECTSTDMSSMFSGVTDWSEIGDITAWDTSCITNMNSMFSGSNFNQDISSWDTSSVNDMSNMFGLNGVFNQPIGYWDMHNVKTVKGMFNSAVAFNQDISSWDTSSVTDMTQMFYFASGFDQDISNWDVTNVESMYSMFSGVNLSTQNYDALLTSWGNQLVQSDNSFDAGYSQYSSEGWPSRRVLINDYNWDISDGGSVCTESWIEDNSTCNGVNYTVSYTDENSCGTAEYLPIDNGTVVYCGRYFSSTWITDNFQIVLPLEVTGEYNFNVDWGDGTTSIITSYDQPEATHSYSSEGTYTINISGKILGFNFNTNPTSKSSILDILSWGDLNLGNSGGYFMGCNNLTITATDELNLTGTTDLSYTFYGASIFNGNISDWNTSDVVDMNNMFSFAEYFNQDISSWDTSQVTDMSNMFNFALAFNQSIGEWNTSNVITMSYMFYNADAFNGNISGWDTSGVIDMSYMFDSAISFNQDIGSWDTSGVIDMSYMFDSAISFNQDIGSWNISNVGTLAGMFSGANLSVSNYDSLLNGWGNQSVQSDNVFDVGYSQYSSAGLIGRNDLINSYRWIIDDGGIYEPVIIESSVDVSPIVDASEESEESSSGGGVYCVSDWKCSEWSSCEPNGTMTRSCFNQNTCGEDDDSPATSQSCLYLSVAPITERPAIVEEYDPDILAEKISEPEEDGYLTFKISLINLNLTPNKKVDIEYTVLDVNNTVKQYIRTQSTTLPEEFLDTFNTTGLEEGDYKLNITIYYEGDHPIYTEIPFSVNDGLDVPSKNLSIGYVILIFTLVAVAGYIFVEAKEDVFNKK